MMLMGYPMRFGKKASVLIITAVFEHRAAVYNNYYDYQKQTHKTLDIKTYKPSSSCCIQVQDFLGELEQATPRKMHSIL